MIMAELSTPGSVGQDMAQEVCTRGLLALSPLTGEAWWGMQYVSKYWKSVFDRAWPAVQRQLEVWQEDVARAYDQWTRGVDFPWPATLPQPRCQKDWLTRHICKPVFFKYALSCYPAPLIEEERTEMAALIKRMEWSSWLSPRLITLEKTKDYTESSDVGSLFTHHPLPLIVRILAYSMRCAENVLEVLFMRTPVPPRQLVSMVLLFTTLCSLRSLCPFFHYFEGFVTRLALYDKEHAGEIVPCRALSYYDHMEYRVNTLYLSQ